MLEGTDFTFTPVEFTAVAEPGWPHPFLQVPYLKEGDLIIYEARAIAKYLLAKKGLYPTEPAKARSVVDSDKGDLDKADLSCLPACCACPSDRTVRAGLFR
jgi:glutathione S-transferase